MSSIPQLTLFPLYPGGPQVRNTGSLNASSSFYLPATQFTPAYGVNVSSSSNNTNKNYAVGSNGTITNRSVSQADSFNRSIAFDGSVLGGLKQAPISAVAPTIPNLYKQAVDLLSVSDLKFSELMAQPSFRLPGIGMGLKVTTDGMGGVDSVSLSPSSRGALTSPSATSPDFGLNRAEITIGATPKIDIDGGLGSVATKKVFNPTNNANTAVTNNLINNQAALIQPNSLAQNTGLFNVNPVGGLQAQGLAAIQPLSNPVLDRLNQLQPRDNGLALSGPDAAISAEQARQIAAGQAKLEVETSERFKNNIANLASASRQTESYASAFRLPNLDGKLPITPYIQSTGQTPGNELGAQSGFDMGSSVADAMDRKSSGGYIPFQMQAGAHGNFGGQSNPFMMSSGFGAPSGTMGDQQRHGQPYKRQPLAFTA